MVEEADLASLVMLGERILLLLLLLLLSCWPLVDWAGARDLGR